MGGPTGREVTFSVNFELGSMNSNTLKTNNFFQWHGPCIDSRQVNESGITNMKCEVVGWLFIDSEKPQALVREESAGAARTMDLPHQAIQTGTFRRGNPIVDPLTQKTIGYEMEALITPFA
jgi:hypothetical protein